jgi:hypothetical protein
MEVILSLRIKESVFQKQCIAELRMVHLHLIPVAIQNETNIGNSYALWKHWEAMGKKKGASDLLIIDTLKKDNYYLEFKGYNILKNGGYSSTSKQSDNQRIFQKIVESAGFKYFLIDSPLKWEEFIESCR